MAAIGLIVEGIYDETVLPVLAKRCRNGVRTVTRKCKGPVIGKLPGLVAELDRSYPGLEKVLVVSDADGRNPEEMEREVATQQACRLFFRTKVCSQSLARAPRRSALTRLNVTSPENRYCWSCRWGKTRCGKRNAHYRNHSATSRRVTREQHCCQP